MFQIDISSLVRCINLASGLRGISDLLGQILGYREMLTRKVGTGNSQYCIPWSKIFWEKHTNFSFLVDEWDLLRRNRNFSPPLLEGSGVKCAYPQYVGGERRLIGIMQRRN